MNTLRQSDEGCPAAPAPGWHRPQEEFHTLDYLRHNARRLEHLAGLGLAVRGLTVLEAGAGIGDHSQYYVDRGCRVTVTDARAENLAFARRRFPGGDVRLLDLESPWPATPERWDVVHCYGVLYHVRQPEPALTFLAGRCRQWLFLETCVSFGPHEAINPVGEDSRYYSQAAGGTGCRPTRPWVFNRLRRLFEFVYVPRTQPNHEEFPLDWTDPDGFRRHSGSVYGLSRAVFIASRHPLSNPLLLSELPDRQVRAE
jgi:hypothetical protein